MGATDIGIPFPDGDDPPLGPEQIALVAIWVGEYLKSKTYAQINALTGAEVWQGRRVYQSDTGTDRPVQGLYVYAGTDWRPPWNSAWGIVPGSRKTMASAGGFVGMADIAGLVTDSFVTVENRLYELVVRIPFQATGGSGGRGAEFQLVDSTDGTIVTGVNAEGVLNPPLALGAVELVLGFDDLTPGPHVFTPRIGRADDATVTLNVGASEIYLKDIGPNGDPV